jgi:hypothetical protein
MATSEVSICNGALIKLGAGTINDLDDNNTRARLVKESYPKMRDLLLRSHPWKFNKAYATLAQIVKPDSLYEYLYLYQLPSDCARVFDVDCENIPWEELEDNTLATNAAQIKIKYGRKITDVTYFDAAFVETLEWAMAADIAYALTQSTSQVEMAKKMYEQQLQTARSYSAQVGSVKQVKATQWLRARGGWR